MIIKTEYLANREIPDNLYIPPDALEVFLSAFEGPLDLLLYLIKKQNIDIFDIPIALISEQYMAYINLIDETKFSIAGDYLLMAAMLGEIKSKMLLPKPKIDIEEDPRAELVKRLQEYQYYKKLSEKISVMPIVGRDIFTTSHKLDLSETGNENNSITLKDLNLAMINIFARLSHMEKHVVKKQPLSISARLNYILLKLKTKEFLAFEKLFSIKEGREGAVISFMAILELLRKSAIQVVQNEPLGKIYVKSI